MSNLAAWQLRYKLLLISLLISENNHVKMKLFNHPEHLERLQIPKFGNKSASGEVWNFKKFQKILNGKSISLKSLGDSLMRKVIRSILKIP